MTSTAQQTETRATAQIRPKTGEYQKSRTSSGNVSKICGDLVANALAGATLDEVYALTSTVVGVEEPELRGKYAAHNLGQQRMFLGNRIRGAVTNKDADKAAKAQKLFDKASASLRKAVDTRIAAETKAAEAAKKQKAADKDARVKAKAADKDAKAKARAEAKKAKEDAVKAKVKAAPKAERKPRKAAAPKSPAKPA